MDTNTNYPTFNGNVSSYLGKTLNGGDIASINSQLGYDQARRNYQFISNGNIYQLQDNGQGGATLSQIDTVSNRQGEAAQQQYQAQQGSAIQTLQTGKANLGQQYSALLGSVTGQFQPLINQQTANVGEQLAGRGIAPGAGLYADTVGSFLQPIYGQQAGEYEQIGAGSIADTNTYNNAISQAQQSGAQFGATLPLEYGSLALSSLIAPSTAAANYASGNYYNNLNPTTLASALIQANRPQMSSNGVVFAPSLAPNTSTGYYLPPGGIGGGKANSTFTLAKRFVSNQNNKRPSTKMISHYVQ